MKKTTLGFALAALAASFAAQATESNGIGYTYVQLDYLNVSQSGHGFVADGASLSGSYGFADMFHVFGSYSDLRNNNNQNSYDNIGVSLKDKPWMLGFGMANSLGNRADWVTQVSYTHDRYSVRACVFSTCARVRDSSNTWAVNTGVQGRVTNKLTANAYIGYSNGGNGVTGQVFGDFGMEYSFNKTWALHGGVRVNGDSQTYGLGARASF